jgi:hypothetical protein
MTRTSALVLVLLSAAAGVTAYERLHEDVYLGRRTQFDAIQDFYFDLNDVALKARKVYVGDVGDPPDLALRRAGPDNAPFDAQPGQLEPGTNIGTIYWQARTPTGWDERNAQIYAVAQGVQTSTTAGGSLHLATTPLAGAPYPRDRLVIEPDGTLYLAGVPVEETDSGARVRVRLPSGRLGWLRVEED